MIGLKKSKIEDLAGLLKQKGMYVTKQRLHVLKLLVNARGTHMSADEIYRELVKKGVKISRPSVFNIVRAFQEHGVIDEIEIAGVKRFDAVTDGHPHFICTRCGEIYDLPTDTIVINYDMIPHKVEKQEIKLKGICQKCLEKKKT